MQYIFIKNILAPYRISLFNKLNEIAFAKDFHFKVYVMAQKEKGRYWSLNQNELQFENYIDKGIYLDFGLYHFMFNPKLIKKIRKEPDAEIILGGSWNNFTVVLICMFKRLGIIKNKLHFWLEANYMFRANKGKLYFWFRKFIINSADGKIIAPGKIAEITVTQMWGLNKKSVVYLPNLINSEKFTIENYEVSKRQENVTITFIIVARLIELYKGILNFFELIGTERLKTVKILIAGEGPDRKRYEEFIHKNELEKNIILLGNQSEEQIIELYKKANVFVLPSIADSNPLTVVEALFMKLPILMSNRCGNIHEAMSEGLNGFSFDPDDQIQVIKAFDTLIQNKSRFVEMGNQSYKMALENFDPNTALVKFINNLTK